METRIKYINKNNAWYYTVQIKKWLFWKTIYTDAIFANVEKFIDKLNQLDDFNNKTKSLNKIIYEGWAVRNVYKNTGAASSIGFFNSPIYKCKSSNVFEIGWTDINDNIRPMMVINTKKLFDKECLEPMKLKITIEQIEE